MTPNESQPPLPCGEGAGGEGRAAAARVEERVTKRGHGWAPSSGEARQKDLVRANGRARRMRLEMTPSEAKLWKLLRDNISNVTFRRQVAIDHLVYDFGVFSARLLIELDGGIHALPENQLRDEAKSEHARTQGFTLLRLKNDDVWGRPDWTLDQVRACLSAPHPPTPSPQGRGGDDL